MCVCVCVHAVRALSFPCRYRGLSRIKDRLNGKGGALVGDDSAFSTLQLFSPLLAQRGVTYHGEHACTFCLSTAGLPFLAFRRKDRAGVGAWNVTRIFLMADHGHARIYNTQTVSCGWSHELSFSVISGSTDRKEEP